MQGVRATVERFLDERCLRLPDTSTDSSELIEAYDRWCVDQGWQDTPSRRAFGLAIRGTGGITVARSNGRRLYRGVRLLP